MLNQIFRDCIAHDGIVAVASSSAGGQAHVVNTWNKYLIVTEDEKILIPCFGFHKTEANAQHNPQLEITIGSHEIQGKMGMGTGFLLQGKGEFLNEGPLFDVMHDKCDFCNRVLVFTPASCTQTI
jgi:hypothetical protein